MALYAAHLVLVHLCSLLVRGRGHTGPVRANDGTGTKGYTVPKHVWVAVDGRWHDRKPGVLVEWRQTNAGAWEALVVWFSGGGNVAWSGRQGWVQADHVRPIKQTAPGSSSEDGDHDEGHGR